jgi:hypothetical protein
LQKRLETLFALMIRSLTTIRIVRTGWEAPINRDDSLSELITRKGAQNSLVGLQDVDQPSAIERCVAFAALRLCVRLMFEFRAGKDLSLFVRQDTESIWGSAKLGQFGRRSGDIYSLSRFSE